MAGYPPRAGAGSRRSETGSGACRAARAPLKASSLTSVIGGSRGRQATGVALRLEAGGEARQDAGFEVVLVADDGSALLALGPYPEEEVVATWRTLGQVSGLPLVIARGDGTLERPFPQIGRLQLGSVRIRRRSGVGARRPRFLARRRTGCWSTRPPVHREAEISASGR